MCPFPPCTARLDTVQFLSGPRGGVLLDHVPSHPVSDDVAGWVGECPAGLMEWPLAEYSHVLLRDVARVAEHLADTRQVVHATVPERISQLPPRRDELNLMFYAPNGASGRPDDYGPLGYPKLLDDQRRLDALAERLLG